MISQYDLISSVFTGVGGFSTAGFYPEMLPMQAQLSGAMAPMMADTPMYRSDAASWSAQVAEQR
jgi:hypothetical protein